MRFVSKVLKDSLHEKFPDATEDELLKVCTRAGAVPEEGTEDAFGPRVLLAELLPGPLPNAARSSPVF